MPESFRNSNPFGLVTPVPRDEFDYRPDLDNLIISIAGKELVRNVDYQVKGSGNNIIALSTPPKDDFTGFQNFVKSNPFRFVDCLLHTEYYPTMERYYQRSGKKDWKLNWKETNATKPKKKPSSLLLGLVKKL